MKIVLLKASKYANVPPGRTPSGGRVIVVNDVFLDNFFRKELYQLWYGGAGSGKSDAKATELLIKALTNKFFRCIFVRKYQTTIRFSQFKLLCDLIKRYDLGEYFSINQQFMSIKCTLNDNELFAVGLDDVEKLRSIAQITDVWIEEPIGRRDSITAEEFRELVRRLRTKEADNHISMTFNPISRASWIYRDFFDIEKKVYNSSVFLLKSTYEDNHFLPKSTIDEYERLKKISPDEYKVFALGEWGDATDADRNIFDYEGIMNMPGNALLCPSGTKFVTVDIAFSGLDRTVIFVWDGWKAIDVKVMTKATPRDVVLAINHTCATYRVQRSCVAYDSTGVGKGLSSELFGALAYDASARPVERKNRNSIIKPKHYANLRAQIHSYIAEKISNGEIGWALPVNSLFEELTEELLALKWSKLPGEGALQVENKEIIKARLGRSPDLADAFVMRALFDIVQQSTLTRPRRAIIA